MPVNSDLLRFVPENATHCLVEPRTHRGESVFAVLAIVPDGASVPLNGYSSEDVANQTASELNEKIAARA